MIDVPYIKSPAGAPRHEVRYRPFAQDTPTFSDEHKAWNEQLRDIRRSKKRDVRRKSQQGQLSPGPINTRSQGLSIRPKHEPPTQPTSGLYAKMHSHEDAVQQTQHPRRLPRGIKKYSNRTTARQPSKYLSRLRTRQNADKGGNVSGGEEFSNSTRPGASTGPENAGQAGSDGSQKSLKPSSVVLNGPLGSYDELFQFVPVGEEVTIKVRRAMDGRVSLTIMNETKIDEGN